MDHQIFKAGAAKVKTTPALGTRINGDFITHYATSVHDDLYAKTLVFEQGDTRVAIIVVDICVLPTDFVEAVKALIHAELGLLPGNVLMSATHTHAAGSLADLHLGSLDPGYARKMPGLIVESVRQAIDRLEPAQVASGTVAAPEHLLCRRYKMKEGYIPVNPVTLLPDQIKTNPFGAEELIDHPVAPVDPDLSYLAVKTLDGNWIGALANYSLHYVGDWPDGTISADYFGVFSARLGELLGAGDDFVGIMSNGTSGDVNIWDFAGTKGYPSAYFEKSRLIGSELASKVAVDLEQAGWIAAPSLSVVYKELSAEIVKPSPGELEKAAATISGSHFETIQATAEGLVQLYAREQLLLNETDDSRSVPVQAIRVGDLTIGALPGEFFSETGLYLKSRVTGGRYFTITLANGNAGYVPPAAEIEKGGYETWRCRYSCLKPGSEAVIREELLALTGVV